ncbi:uncharacterized protein B0I36DRAFT_356300 [Microdochium trichocladiopsis]|uniref:Uncharacterized protein n=1 Tax=Microdochium trichocladiopsis TaxID=1682393 RepID=A0A9P8XQR1_9PEZI|nr:uncharacterized protein B0I36DRAFT_356300 [Microdochium trichocladiopsis]KAH7012218.1 hypothetical protein B0I36DRAFT_356300 [Microdochium trichocladiopsis]
MSSERRFFFLQDSLPATYIDSLLARVVKSKTSPPDCFAPHSSPGVPPHNTNDIILSILLEPNTSSQPVNRGVITPQRGINGQLSILCKAELHKYKEQSLSLECDKLRRYTIPNPNLVFQRLMANEHYKTDVHLGPRPGTATVRLHDHQLSRRCQPKTDHKIEDRTRRRGQCLILK